MSRRPIAGHLRRRACAVVVVGIALSILLMPVEVLAFPRVEGNCGHRTQVSYRYDGAGWTAARQTEVNLAIADLNVPRRVDGAQIWTHTAVATGGIPLRVNFGTFGSFVACNSGAVTSINIAEFMPANNGTATLGSSFRGATAHEFGHAHSLRHAGDNDSFGGGVPTMTSGCEVASDNDLANLGQQLAILAQDDYSAILWHHDLDSGRRSITANSSFENGTSYWGTTNASISSQSGGGSNGPKFARIAPSSSGGSIYVTSRITNSANSSFRIQGASRDTAAVASGNVTMSLQTRRVDFPNNNCSGQFDVNQNTNHPTLLDASFITRFSESCNPISTITWAGCGNTHGWSSTSEGHDVRVRIASTRKNSSGTLVPIDVDYVRVMLTH